MEKKIGVLYRRMGKEWQDGLIHIGRYPFFLNQAQRII